MSDQDRFDWDDDMDFESLADEQMADVASDTIDGDFVEEEAVEPPAMDLETPVDEKPTARSQAPGSSLGLSAGGLGFLFGVSTLVSALGLGGALLFVSGIDPTTLWKPEGLLQVDQWFNFQEYPLNILYLLTFGIVTLTLLGSWAVARGVRGASSRHHFQAAILDKLVGLRLDNEKPWQDPDFKADPRVSAFVAETLGSWRLQMAREKKNSGLEGELRRLHKSLEARSRDDLVGNYENPHVGTLSDAVVQLFDENEASRSEMRSIKDKDGTRSQELMGLIQDARSWHRGTGGQVGEQGAAVEGLVARLAELSALAGSLKKDEGSEAISAAVADITREVETWSRQDGGNKAADLHDLVDRGSKLAFQIAMEVARLGTRGERLLPMTQSLEELTTEFREATTALAQDSGTAGLEEIKNRLNQVQDRLSRGAGPAAENVAEKADGAVSQVNQVQNALNDLTRQFEAQTQRLDSLGSQLGEFTGQVFDPSDVSMGNPDNPPEGGLNLAQHDPFGRSLETTEDPVAEVDPFSKPASVPKLNLEPALPQEEEKVYDLAEFGAVRLDGAADEADADEKVHDLSEFGAVALT